MNRVAAHPRHRSGAHTVAPPEHRDQARVQDDRVRRDGRRGARPSTRWPPSTRPTTAAGRRRLRRCCCPRPSCAPCVESTRERPIAQIAGELDINEETLRSLGAAGAGRPGWRRRRVDDERGARGAGPPSAWPHPRRRTRRCDRREDLRIASGRHSRRSTLRRPRSVRLAGLVALASTCRLSAPGPTPATVADRRTRRRATRMSRRRRVRLDEDGRVAHRALRAGACRSETSGVSGSANSSRSGESSWVMARLLNMNSFGRFTQSAAINRPLAR